MIALDKPLKPLLRDLPSVLRGLPRRPPPYPRLDSRYPCLQLEAANPNATNLLVQWSQGIPGVEVKATELSVPGQALVLWEELARGTPEAFIFRQEFAIIRRDGSVQLTLLPEWGQRVLDKRWATVHPLVRYLAGALPPQHLVVYAPQDARQLRVVQRIILAAYFYALGGLPEDDQALLKVLLRKKGG